ncbi:MAG: histone deacetylase family protein, partial [Akkermansiaceae bacterium]|nr:histone deacetylase family protein [Akkermansiaceae bacterium]
MDVALFSHPKYDLHRMSEGHPECPERTQAILKHFRTTGLLEMVATRESRPVTPEALARTHQPAYLRSLADCAPASGLVPIDADTLLAPGSLQAANLAAGAVEEAVDLVLKGDLKRAFCAGRPPGHHAEFADAMGFCFFNNVAVAARTALAHRDIERVAILDFDVHHGNGTVDIFEKSPEVLVCSSFQHPFYPHRHFDTPGEHLVHT